VKIVGWILVVFGVFAVIRLPAQIEGNGASYAAGAVTTSVVILALGVFFLVRAYREQRIEREYAARKAREASSSIPTSPPPPPPPPPPEST
jgi:uncharacterized membrane protein